MKKSKVLLISILAFMLGAVSISAASQVQTVSATINSALKIVLNGKVFTPKDESGKKIETLTYKGRTYLPIRVILDEFDIPVSYEGSTSTIELGTKVEAVDLIKANAYDRNSEWGDVYQSVDPDKLTLATKKFKSGVISENKYRGGTNSFKLDLNKKYTTLSLDVALIDGQSNYKIMIVDKNSISLKETIIDSEEVVNISVNVAGLEAVWVKMTHISDKLLEPETMIIGDITAK